MFEISRVDCMLFNFQANERCIKLTNGCCYVSLLQALKVRRASDS